MDEERYQTVFGEKPGAVAAPTAGLHFDESVMARLEARGIRRTFVTLHVGAGTFQPVRTEDIREHQMHQEWLSVEQSVVDAVAETRARGGRVVAVGTTAVRALESASAGGRLAPFEGDTGIFIYPGYRFRSTDAMITNFHLPESTLIMLVSAFAGRDQTLAAYRAAIAERYRFFSYGDAMLVFPHPDATGGRQHPLMTTSVQMRFETLASDGPARRGRSAEFPRGDVETPAFMPVGTYGTVRA